MSMQLWDRCKAVTGVVTLVLKMTARSSIAHSGNSSPSMGRNMVREDCEGIKRLDIHDSLTMALYLGHCELRILIALLSCSFSIFPFFYLYSL